MEHQAINFADTFSTFSTHWEPHIVAELNNYEFKLVKIRGDFVWHQHSDTDEAFIVLEGSMMIEFRDGKVQLEAGEMYVVPKGVEHKPFAAEECQILLIEPTGVINTGDADSEMTAANGISI